MKPSLNPYLNFKDNTRQAMEFYQTVFGGELEFHTFEEYHASDDPAEANKIMHSMLTTPGGMVFMAADTPNHMEYHPVAGFNMSLSGGDDAMAELSGYFEKLLVGGTATMPLGKSPWGATFGMLTDKFGVQWLVNIGGME